METESEIHDRCDCRDGGSIYGKCSSGGRTPSMLIGEVSFVNLAIPVVAIIVCIIAFLYGKFHKRDDD